MCIDYERLRDDFSFNRLKNDEITVTSKTRERGTREVRLIKNMPVGDAD